MFHQWSRNQIQIRWFFILLLTASAAAEVGPNWIEQWGIRWTFDKNISLNGTSGTYQYGTYANGDYWIVGPVKIISIDPPYSVVNSPIENGGTFTGRIINGSTINPIPSNRQSYDSAADGWLPEFCVNSNISNIHPLFIQVSSIPIQSLISTKSTTIVPSKRSHPRLQTAAILTVVSSPSINSFRPPYAGNIKPENIDMADIKWNVLANLLPVNGTPVISEYEELFKRPWLVHKGTYPAEVIQPVDNMPNYGRELARESGIAALLLNLNYTQKQKETLLIRFLQYGIDVYGIANCQESLVPEYCTYSPQRIWYGAGTIGVGKKIAAVFAAKVLGHTGMVNMLAKSGDYLYEGTDINGYPNPYGPGISNFPSDYIQFGEEQFFYVKKIHVDLSNNQAPSGWPEWTPTPADDQYIPYKINDIGLPDWGERVAEKPWVINKWFGVNYRLSSGSTLISSILACHIMGAKEIYHHNAAFDYADRHIAVISEFEEDKPWRIGINGVDLFITSPFVWNMWRAYRQREGHSPVWTSGQAADTVPPLAPANLAMTGR
ncbi:MAG: hypothetical protein JW828_05665, partial [Sedimentisphaerales bacterium]|nr:hypothetical protein [Sedimentisphaerales bacterium]